MCVCVCVCACFDVCIYIIYRTHGEMIKISNELSFIHKVTLSDYYTDAFRRSSASSSRSTLSTVSFATRQRVSNNCLNLFYRNAVFTDRKPFIKLHDGRLDDWTLKLR